MCATPPPPGSRRHRTREKLFVKHNSDSATLPPGTKICKVPIAQREEPLLSSKVSVSARFGQFFSEQFAQQRRPLFLSKKNLFLNKKKPQKKGRHALESSRIKILGSARGGGLSERHFPEYLCTHFRAGSKKKIFAAHARAP